MADDETRKLHTEDDDADVTVVLSTLCNHARRGGEWSVTVRMVK